MNSGNSKICDPHRLLLNLSDEIHLKRSLKIKINMLNLNINKLKDKYVALSNLSIYYTWKIVQKS